MSKAFEHIAVHHAVAPAEREARPRRRGLITLAELQQVADTIVHTLGSHSEVVFHDLSDPERSIVAIAGDVTRRGVGDGPGEQLMARILSGDYKDLLNYRTFTRDGRVLRSSTVFLRDEEGRPRAALCVNVDISAFLGVERLLRSMTAAESAAVVTESFAEDAEETIKGLVAEAAAEVGKPLDAMARAERVRLVGLLDGRGAFQIRRAVPLVAAQFGVSRYTVYTYLQQARGERNDAQ